MSIFPEFIKVEGKALTITATPRERVLMRQYCRVEGEYKYPQMDETMYSLLHESGLEFEPDAGQAGLALFSGPVLIQRSYFPEGPPQYNENDDDAGTDWENSGMWFDGYYAFRHPVEQLINQGYVTFLPAE